LTDLSSVLSQSTRVTDRQTDEQNCHRYVPRLHYMQRGKNDAEIKEPSSHFVTF